MKSNSFLLITIGLAALTIGPGFADEAPNQERDPLPAEKIVNAARDSLPGTERDRLIRAGKRDGSHTSAQDRLSGKRPSGDSRLTRPQPLWINSPHPSDQRINKPQSKSLPGSIPGLSQPVLNKPASAAKTATSLTQMASHRDPPVAGLSTPHPPNQIVPRRGPGPAIVDGSVNLNARNTAVLNGTGMKHRP